MTPRSLLCLLLLVLAALPARGEEPPRRLLYLSAETTKGSSYGGIGAMQAWRGLDRSGPVATVEAGRNLTADNRLGVMAGWRLVGYGVYATALLGVEVGDGAVPAGSLDLWWNNTRGWMASARTQHVEGSDDSTRFAAGYRLLGADRPWLGPELVHNWQGTRLGLHVTGVKLPLAFEARLSAGRFEGGSDLRPVSGSYLELSLWRRF